MTAPTPPAAIGGELKPDHVYVEVSGLTGTGKSAVMGEIEIALRALGLPVEHDADFQAEKNGTHSDWQAALDLYKPTVVLRERNVSRAAPPPAEPTPERAEGETWYAVRDAIARAMQDERDGKPCGGIIEAGCEARQYDDPSYAADGFIVEATNAVLAALSPHAATGGEAVACLSDPATVYINMLRGGIAKPSPTCIGHLYRGDDAKAVVAEVIRQNPQAAPPAPVEVVEAAKALEAAERFIVNGIAFGFIRMPERDTPDPAHDTLPTIQRARKALARLSGQGA